MTARGSWQTPAKDPLAPPMADRVIRKAVRKALLAAPIQSRLTRCADHVGGFGGAVAPGPDPTGKPAVFMLEMETLGNEVRIVDAQVREWGEASDATVSCARDVLRGQVVARSNAPLGKRISMPFPLKPRSEPVASSQKPLER
jgi:hypothetical protein